VIPGSDGRHRERGLGTLEDRGVVDSDACDRVLWPHRLDAEMTEAGDERFAGLARRCPPAEFSAPLCFYIPSRAWPTRIPSGPDDYWAQARYDPRYWQGKYAFTVLTYLYLRDAGVRCELTDRPSDGAVVISHFDFLPTSRGSAFLVSMQADRARRRYAHIYVVHNPVDAVRQATRFAARLGATPSYYLPPWPQPGLIPRDRDRRDRFENVAFFGNLANLAPELREPSWAKQLRQLGIAWSVARPEHWDDFRDVDAIVAVRSYSRDAPYLTKSALKLTNAWRAGVPALLGAESAYAAERRSSLDYIEVTTLRETLDALAYLRDDVALRHAMAENGLARAVESDPARIIERWCQFINDCVAPMYERWQTKAWVRQHSLWLGRAPLAIKAKTRGMRRVLARLKRT
jgi:hypothetical protein